METHESRGGKIYGENEGLRRKKKHITDTLNSELGKKYEGR